MKKTRKRPLILVSNDDGIDAPGIYALARAMEDLGAVTVVAPDKQQSAVGHAITMNYPLRVSRYSKGGSWFGYAVEGTPADCVKLAVKNLVEGTPDLLVSGINLGSNTAINIIYSGTVSAATEGTILGIPSIAISLTSHEKRDFRYAAKFAKRIAALVLRKGLPDGTLLNVNVPAIAEKEIAGVRLTRQGRTRFNDEFDVRRDPNNKEYFWLTGDLEILDHSKETDQISIMERFVSVTPIQYDLTDYRFLRKMQGWNIGSLHPRKRR